MKGNHEKDLRIIKEGEQYRVRYNKEVFANVEKISDANRKREISFYDHLWRMSENRISKRFFMYLVMC